MKRSVVVALLMGVVLEAQAITWDFSEDGSLQGWIAQEGDLAANGDNPQALHTEVRDGIWRVQIPPFQQGRNPEIMLASPIIGHDSALFDRMAIRFRVVHTQPISGGEFTLRWTNPANLSYPGGDPSNLSGPCVNPNCHPRFWLVTKPLYTTDWQEITIEDLRSRVAQWPYGKVEDRAYSILWEGNLVDFRVDFLMVDEDQHVYVQSPDEVPEAVEIDWIKLTGVEEQLQGELPPPPTASSIPSGSLFGVSVFYPLGVRQVGSVGGSQATGALGDLDGDGDLDLVTRWADKNDYGWLLAFNDGKGGFTSTQIERFQPADIMNVFVGGTDLDGNGRMELVLYPGNNRSPDNNSPIQEWLNDPKEGWIKQELPDFYPIQITDLDKNGGMDVWGWGLREDELFMLRVLLNDGKGKLSLSTTFNPPMENSFAFYTVYPTTPSKRIPLVWMNPSQTLSVAYQSASGEWIQEPLPALKDLKWNRVVQVGDFDLNGDTDLITNDQTSERVNEANIFPTTGLNFLHNRGDGQMDTLSAFPDIKYNGKVQVTDVNRDGLVDVVVWHYDLRTPSIVVLVQQRNGRFVQEGEYPLPVGRGGSTLTGDLDGDGDVDLVVFDSFVAGGGGVHVFLSQLANQITAVEEEAAITLPQFRLGAAYPNPFNPGVVIPFTLGPLTKQISLTIYNTLGQEVRKLELGVLPAGAHQAEWDGRDEAGKVLSSGVYLYRLQADKWSASSKMVKSQ